MALASEDAPRLGALSTFLASAAALPWRAILLRCTRWLAAALSRVEALGAWCVGGAGVPVLRAHVRAHAWVYAAAVLWLGGVLVYLAVLVRAGAGRQEGGRGFSQAGEAGEALVYVGDASVPVQELPGVCHAQDDDDAETEVDDEEWTTVSHRPRVRRRQPSANLPTARTKPRTRCNTPPSPRMRARSGSGIYLNSAKGIPAGRGAVALGSQRGFSTHASWASYPAVSPAEMQAVRERSLQVTLRSNAAARNQLQEDDSDSDAEGLTVSPESRVPAGTPTLKLSLFAARARARRARFVDTSGTDSSDPDDAPPSQTPSKPATNWTETTPRHTRAFTAPATPQAPQASSRWPYSALRQPRGRYTSNSPNWRARHAASVTSRELVLTARPPATSGDSLTCFQLTLYSAYAGLALNQRSGVFSEGRPYAEVV